MQVKDYLQKKECLLKVCQSLDSPQQLVYLNSYLHRFINWIIEYFEQMAFENQGYLRRHENSFIKIDSHDEETLLWELML